MTVLTPKRQDFNLVKGSVKDGMQMRCGACACSCTSCASCSCTPCRHPLETAIVTRR